MARKRTSYIKPKTEAEAEVPVIQIVLQGGGEVTSVNGMKGDVVLKAEDVGAVSGAVTINGKPLAGEVDLTAEDVGAISVDDVAETEEAREVLEDVFGQGGIAPAEDAQQVLEDVFGQGGIAPAEEARKVLDDVFGNDQKQAAPPGQTEGSETGVASVNDAKRILQKIFG